MGFATLSLLRFVSSVMAGQRDPSSTDRWD